MLRLKARLLNFKFIPIFFLITYLFLGSGGEAAYAGCSAGSNGFACSNSPCNYTCQTNGTSAHENCIGYDSAGPQCSAYGYSYETEDRSWSCDTHKEALEVCGNGQTDVLSGLGCSIAAPASVTHGQNINWAVSLESGSTMTSINVTGNGVCGGFVGTGSQPCFLGMTTSSCTARTTPNSSAVRTGTCTATIGTLKNGATRTCSMGVGVDCTPSGTNTKIGYPMDASGNVVASEQAILNNKNNGDICITTQLPSVNYGAHGASALTIPAGVDVICVKGVNSASLDKQRLRYEGPGNAVNIRNGDANSDRGYAFRIRTLLTNFPTQTHNIKAYITGGTSPNPPNGYCISQDNSPSLFNVLSCTAAAPAQVTNPSSSPTTTTVVLGWSALTTGQWGTKCPQPNDNRYFISLWKVSDGSFVYNQADIGGSTSGNANSLTPSTVYNWRVDTSNNAGTTKTTGTVWSFTTATPPPPPPDLTISPTTEFSVTSGLSGASTTVQATVRNLGAGPAGTTSNAGFIWNTTQAGNPTCTGAYNANATIPALAVNGNSILSPAYTLPAAGTYTACVRLDTAGAAPNYQVAESNENNNVFFANYTVSNAAYFRTIGGDISARLGPIVNPSPPAGTYLSANNTGLSDAGLILTSGTITPTTSISQLGSAPGTSAINYTLNTPTFTSSPISGADPTYGTFLDNTVKNLGFANYSDLSSTPNKYCNGTADATLTNNDRIVRGAVTYHLWCTTSSQTLDTVLNRIIVAGENSPTYFHIIIPHPTQLSASQTISAKNFSAAAKNIVAFINGSLSVTGNVQTQGAANSTFMAIMNTSATSLSVTGATTILDGAYVMPGTIDNNSDGIANPSPLIFRGVLVSTSNVALGSGLKRSPAGSAGEIFTYDPRYLAVMNGVITRPIYNWKELPPTN